MCMESVKEYISSDILKKSNTDIDQKDLYCFQCHKRGELIHCHSCSRSYHLKCTLLLTKPGQNWTCSECDINQPTLLKYHSNNEFHCMLNYAYNRLISHPQVEYFLHTTVDLEGSNYFHFILHPMDFEIIKANIQRQTYSSTLEFIGDIKWILHNCIVYNGDQSKLTSIARNLLKITRQEMKEIETCPECYLRCTQQTASNDWFTKPCMIPHTLCWAKMKTYPIWPAKVLRIVNDEVDVRFFGEHNRALVPIENCFVLSKEYPELKRKKTNFSFENSMKELNIHINQLKERYGQFLYAPLRMPISKTKSFKFISIIDDSCLPSYTIATNFVSRLSRNHSKKHGIKRSNEQQHIEIVKRQRITSNNVESKNLDSTLNVLDQFGQIIQRPRKIPSTDRSVSPTDSKLRIQALLRKYLDCQSTPTITTADLIMSDVRLSINTLLDNIVLLETKSNCNESSIENHSFDERITLRKTRKIHLPNSGSYQNSSLRPLLSKSLRCAFFSKTPFSELGQSFLLLNFKKTVSSSETFESITSVLNDDVNSFQRTSSTSIENDICQDIVSINCLPQQSTNIIHNRTNNILSNYSNSTRNDMQIIINNFHNQFHRLLENFTEQIHMSFKSAQEKYEQDLKDIHRDYRLSLNNFHLITHEQIRNIQNDLDIQYWNRINNMQNRFESK